MCQPAKWRVPNDFTSAHQSQTTGVPLVTEKNQIAKVIARMAAETSGQDMVEPQKKKFSLFGS